MGEDTRQDRQDASGHPSTERVSVPQAADHLGTTVDAIRKRVQRRTIPYEKDAEGRVWILLDTGRPRQDADQDTTGRGRDSAVVGELRDRIRYLERQVEEEREARRRADTILAQLSRANEEQARTIRAIEAPTAAAPSHEPPQAPTEATEQPGRVEPQPAVEGTREPAVAADEQQGRGPIPEASSPQAATERSWWQRWFGPVDR
jgi:hypothetical protein